MHAPHCQLFLSTVSSEFRSYRLLLADDLKRPNLEVKSQEDFVTTGGCTLGKLDDYIRHCHAIVHLVGKATGAVPEPPAVAGLLKKYPDLPAKLPALTAFLKLPQPGFSYTQWEAYLAIYHERPVYIYLPTADAPRDPGFTTDPAQEQSQAEHHQRICDLGRDRGQFANPERLSSRVLRDLVEILPRLHLTIDVAATHLRHTAEQLIGRDSALTRLDEAWENSHKNVVVIRAWGGVGKTALVATWMAEMALKGWRGAQRVFDWSFYSQGTRAEGGEKEASADLFMAEALRFFGDPDPTLGSPWDRGARLARLVSRSKALLVLDGLEPLQHPPGPMVGQLKDPGVSALLKGLAQHNEGLCIVTTREKVDDLKHFYSKTADDWELSHLSAEAGAELLKTLGVGGSGKERRAASHSVKGHALTLQLMGRYLALAHGGDIRKRDTFAFTEADNEVQGGHAFRVLKAYETWLSASGEAGRRQLAILRLLGLFDRPADPGCLAALREPPVIDGLTQELANLSEAQWNIAVKRLEDIGLVTPVAYEARKVLGYNKEIGRKAMERSYRNETMNLPDPEEFRPAFRIPHNASSLEAHPLLREHFGKQLRSEANAAWQAGHRRLFEHLQASVPYWADGVEGLGPLYQAVAHGCQAGLEQLACDEVYTNRILRGTGPGGFYSWIKLGAIGANLGAVACFFPQPWRTLSPNLTAAAQAWLLNEAALSLRALGRLIEAVVPMRASMDMDVAKEKWKGAAISASNLSELELTLGEVSAAVADGEQAVFFADRSQDAFQRMGKRTTHADALHQAGRRDEALRLCREAEDMQAEDQPEYPRLYSSQGFRSCDVLLADVERAAWRITMQRPCVATGCQPVEKQPASWKLAATEQQTLQTVCEEVTQRAKQTLQWVTQGRASILSITLDKLTLARTALYAALLDPSSPFPSCDSAVDGLRRAGTTDYLPRGLLTRAWVRWLNGDEAGCRADLDEAWEVAEPGPMRLHMADILLTRARLFRDRAALAQARTLIEQCGYWRRKEELEDAEAALG